MNWKYILNKFKFALMWQENNIYTNTFFNQLSTKEKNNYKIINSFGFVLFWFLIGFSLLNLIRGIAFPDGNYAASIWFTNLATFTVQSNILITIFFVWYYLSPKHKVFKNYSVIVIICAYITITFIGYNFFIGIRIKYSTWLDHSDNIHRIDAATSMWDHILAPILAILFWMLEARYFKKLYNEQINQKQMYKYGKIIGYGMVYPVVYLFYALIISLTNVHVVYNGFTNLNPNLGFYSKEDQLLVINGDDAWIYKYVNDGNSIGQPVKTDDVIDNFTLGSVINIVYFLIFLILFALFLFVYRISFNRLFFPELKNKIRLN